MSRATSIGGSCHRSPTERELAVELSDYLAKRLESLRPEEASAARVLREAVKNQRLDSG